MLKKIVRETLDAHAPPDDFDRIVQRVDKRRRRTTLTFVLVPALAIAVAIFVFLARKPAPYPEPQASHRVHVYLRAGDEPESRALTLDFDLKGEH